jgi:uncharacterized membrane protein YphA (DoxX/SURF4 family)
MADQAAGFIGGAFHNIGLTFLSTNVWFWLLVIGEITAGALIVLGVFTRFAAGFIIVVMIGAIHTKGRTQGWFVDKDMILAVLALGLALAGNGAYSLEKRCCKACTGSCGTMAQPTAAPVAKATPAKKPVKNVIKKKTAQKKK